MVSDRPASIAWVSHTAEISADWPTSGWAIRQISAIPSSPRLICMVGRLRSSTLRLSSQAVVTMKQGLKNSDGWNWNPGNWIQRAAPLAPPPMNGTSSNATRQPSVPMTASRFSRRMSSIEVASISGRPSATQPNWR